MAGPEPTFANLACVDYVFENKPTRVTYQELQKQVGNLMNDRLSDLATRIRNAYLVGKQKLTLPHTKLLENVARVLHQEKYLQDVEVKKGQPVSELVLTLAYAKGRPAINQIKRVSKPGVRIYRHADSLRPVLSGLGLRILSTSQGVMSDKQAKSKKLGGEVLLELW